MASVASTTPRGISISPRPIRWTCVEFHRFGDLGLFEGRRAFLIDGTLMEQGPMNPPHAMTVGLGQLALQTAFGPGWWVRVQLPMVLGQYTDPQPDLVVVPGNPRNYPTHPSTADLVVEVADTSLRFDTNEKRLLYAEAGIREYWVIDVNGRELIVFRDPQPTPNQSSRHDYAVTLTLKPTDRISPLAAPAAYIRVADLLN
jgi:Uma2 family endonuclease